MVAEFLLQGFGHRPEDRLLAFVVFLFIYVTTLMGNSLIILAIQTDPRLHTPMYFFLHILATLDICNSSVIVPKILTDTFLVYPRITVSGCLVQMFFFISLMSTDFFLLSVMGLDRYVAICNPLRYQIVMNKQFCLQLATAPWIIGFFNSLLHTLLIMRLSFCGPNIINQCYCDLLPLLALSCTNTLLNQLVIKVAGGIQALICFALTAYSYVYIISAIQKIPSTKGKRKAFSTCSSHLTVMVLLYGTGLFSYLRPDPGDTQGEGNVIPVIYGVSMPMLNPLIYSLRNNDVKAALRSVFSKVINKGHKVI